MESDCYVDIISERYSSKEMRALFSTKNIIRNWRKCWVALAESEMELGIKEITKEMVQELKDNIDHIDLKVAAEKEKEYVHDVAAHIYTYGLICPKAKGIIHLGATSQTVKCNTDLIIQRDALQIIKSKLISLLRHFSDSIDKYKAVPTLGYTHFQSAQPTTIGKRFCMYAQDFLSDLEQLNGFLNAMKFRGIKGATGTQASFLALFNGDHAKVEELDKLFSNKLGFSNVFPIATQTYTRKQDIAVAVILANICSTAKKFATDLRLLSNLKFVQESFGKAQIGSSAMPYKKNPIKSERICSLSRKVINNVADFYQIYSEQWLERSLDDSAIRRIDIPENFMLTENVLDAMIQIMSGIVVNESYSKEMLENELPQLAAEEIIIAAVRKGKDRQTVHEAIKDHTQKAEGKMGDLFEMLAGDSRIGLDQSELKGFLDLKSFLGRSEEQADNFNKNYLRPLIK